MSTAWGEGTWGSDSWGGSQSAISGNAASGAVGTAAPVISVALSGVFAIGDLTGVVPDDEVPTLHDVFAVGSIGTATSSTTVALTGVGATGSVDTVVFRLQISGVEAVGTVGSVSVGDRSFALTGVGATGAVGDVVFSYFADLSGVSGFGIVEDVGVNLTLPLSGVAATGNVDTVTFFWQAGAVEAAGEVGTITDVSVSVALSGVEGFGLVAAESPDVTRVLTGVGATGAIETVTMGQRLVAITGCQAMGQVGDIGLRFWSLIDTAEDAGWTNITTQAA